MNEDIRMPGQPQEEVRPKRIINYTLWGWVAIILSAIGSYFLFILQPQLKTLPQLPEFSPLLIILGTFISLLIGVIILQLATIILKIQTCSWKRALATVGFSSLAGIILGFIFLIFGESIVANIIRAVLVVVIWFWIAMKIYEIRFGKAVTLFFVQILLGIVLALVLGGLTFLVGRGVVS